MIWLKDDCKLIIRWWLHDHRMIVRWSWDDFKMSKTLWQDNFKKFCEWPLWLVKTVADVHSACGCCQIKIGRKTPTSHAKLTKWPTSKKTCVGDNGRDGETGRMRDTKIERKMNNERSLKWKKRHKEKDRETERRSVEKETEWGRKIKERKDQNEEKEKVCVCLCVCVCVCEREREREIESRK
jgi:hypothetical protein